jgi:hypothetical protein
MKGLSKWDLTTLDRVRSRRVVPLGGLDSLGHLIESFLI